MTAEPLSYYKMPDMRDMGLRKRRNQSATHRVHTKGAGQEEAYSGRVDDLG